MSTPISNATSPQKTFSPVNVSESPLTSQKGQLRGSPRIIRDAAAELFNGVQEWNKLQISGMTIINGIVDKKLEQFSSSDVSAFPSGLQEDCNKLEVICSELNSVVQKMEQLFKKFMALVELEEMNNRVKIPIFISWTVDIYVSTTKTIYDAYNQEVQVKFYIKENIAHVNTKENLMLMCALWAYSPYIDSVLDFYIESMLKETGHR